MQKMSHKTTVKVKLLIKTSYINTNIKVSTTYKESVKNIKKLLVFNFLNTLF